jgi:hypothetical protein
MSDGEAKRGLRSTELDWQEHLLAARCKRVTPFGFDGANFNIPNVNASGALLVTGTFTASVASQVTVNVAGAATLYAVVNTSAAAGGVTAFIAGSTTLFAVVNVGAAGTVTTAIASSVTLYAQVNTQVTVAIGAGATIGVGAHNVTAFVAGGATIGIGNSTVTAFVRETRLDHAAIPLFTAMGFPVGGLVKDGVDTPLSDGDFGIVRVNVNRAWATVLESPTVKAHYVNVTNNALHVRAADTFTITPSGTMTVALGLPTTVPISIASTVTITPSGTMTVALGLPTTVTVDTELPAAGALADGAANPTTPVVGALLLQAKYVDAVFSFDRIPHSYYQSRLTVGTSSGAGLAIDMTMGPCSKFGLEIENQSGTTSAWNINLEGSMDNASYFTILNQTSATGLANLTFIADKPVRYCRSNVTSVTGGGAVRVRILAMNR